MQLPDGRKLFLVECLLEATVVVLAEDADDAESIASGVGMDVFDDDSPSFRTQDEIGTAKGIPHGWHNSIPWGEDDSDGTVAELFAEMEAGKNGGMSEGEVMDMLEAQGQLNWIKGTCQLDAWPDCYADKELNQ